MARFILIIFALTFWPVNIYAQNIPDGEYSDDEYYDEEYEDEFYDEESPDFPCEVCDTNELKPRFGVFYDFGLNFHTSDFSNLPGVANCCPEFTGAFATGLRTGALAIYPFDYQYFATLRAGFAYTSGQFKSAEATTVIVDGVSQPGEFEHLLDFELGEIAINPAFGYRAWRHLIVEGGVAISFPVHTYYFQREEVSQPADRGTFTDGTRRRGESDGEIPEAAGVGVALTAGASYEFPLRPDRALMLAPEIFYKFHLTPYVSGISWNSHNIYIGASVRYKEPPPPPPPPPPPLPAPLPGMPAPPEAPEIYASVSAVEVDSTGEVRKNFSIRIEDFISRNMRPLLNYIFFEENSAEIPERYHLIDSTEAGDFSMKSLREAGALETYYHVLNIIGMRLRENPDERITLVGTNSNTDAEKGNLELSRQRAEAIRDYFAEVWDIKPSRMQIVARNLPKKYSRTDEPSGQQENRRVEIIPTGDELTEPVITIDTMRAISARNVRFMPEITAEAGLSQWMLNVSQGGRELFSAAGDSIPENIEWRLEQENGNSPKTAENIEYRLAVRDSLGQRAASKTMRLPVEKISIDRKRLERIEDREFEYYSLILFDYGTTRLDREHRKTVDFVKNRITPQAEVYIYGYTDRIGEEDVNKRISERRAQAVARRLRIPDAKVEGLGESDLLFDNELPEGRFYCRTVRIIIETSVHDDDDE